MSTKAAAILEQIRTLSPEEQREVTQALSASQANEKGAQDQRDALKRLRGSSKGKGLLTKLLQERNKERARG